MNSAVDMGLTGGALLSELERFAPDDGTHESPWPGLAIFRASEQASRIPVVYKPCLCLVAHGRKQVHLGDEVYTYDPLNYLVVAVPLPVEAEIIEASPARPFVSLRLDIDVSVLSKLLIDADIHSGPDEAPRGIYASRMNQDLSGAVIRLLRTLHNAKDVRVLAPLAVREILYHVLIGEQGERLRSAAMRDSRAHRIGAVLRFMQENYRRSLGINELAEQAYMSPSTLHHNFKSVTAMSPLQYLKLVRLHQARLLMLHDGVSAGEAAHSVGYNSPSQFSREFKRLFGTPPIRELKRLQSTAGEPARGLPVRTNF
jgi:AraC-like DNA-binding protein